MFVDSYYYALNEKSFDWNSQSYIDSLCNITNTVDILINKALDTIELGVNELCNSTRTGLIVGSSLAGLNSESSISLINANSNSNVFSPGYLLRTIQKKYGFNNLAYALSNTCVTGIDGLKIANDLFLDNKIDRCLLVSYDKADKFIKSGLASYNLLSNSNVLQPFNKNGKGILLQGAASVILLSQNRLKTKRNNTLKILSACLINDGYAISSFSLEFKGIKKAITESLHEANLSIDDITTIFCSTNGVYENDIKYLHVLNDLSYHGIISSIKHLTKHTLGASSIIEMLVSYEVIIQGLLNKVCYGYRIMNKGIDKYSINCTEREGTFMIIGTGFSGVTGAFIYRID